MCRVLFIRLDGTSYSETVDCLLKNWFQNNWKNEGTGQDLTAFRLNLQEQIAIVRKCGRYSKPMVALLDISDASFSRISSMHFAFSQSISVEPSLKLHILRHLTEIVKFWNWFCGHNWNNLIFFLNVVAPTDCAEKWNLIF
jgi:hypothetical protein